MKHIFLILLLLLPFSVFSQEPDGEEDVCQIQADSLLSLITSDTPDSVKSRLYSETSFVSDNSDTVLKYAFLSLNLCGASDINRIGDNYGCIGWAYYVQGKSREALDYRFMAVKCYEKNGNLARAAVQYNNIGRCYHELNVKDSMFFYFNKALEIFETLKDTAEISNTYRYIAIVNYDLGYTESAIEFHLKAMRLDSMTGNYLDIARSYQNLGLVETGTDNRKALAYLKKSIEIFDTIPTDDFSYIFDRYMSYRYIADTYIVCARETGDKTYADSCRPYLQKIGNYFLKAGDYEAHIEKLRDYSACLSFKGDYKQALKVLLECQQYFREDENDVFFKEYYEDLASAYENAGDFKNALEAYRKARAYEKSYVNDSTLNILADFKTEQATKIHEYEKRELVADQRRMQTLIFSLAAGLILVSLLVFYILRMLSVKKKANAEISAQRDEISIQKEIITQQWHDVEDVNSKLLQSINYAQRIQSAAVSKQSEVDALFPENFVYYMPRDIVSGDFYRVVKCGKYRVLITADCTGHGIPGAFLSMLGISGLKEFCVTESDAENPGTVLDRMRGFIKATLVSGTGKALDDGMDMTICSFDFEAMEMRYATANQTAYLVRRGEVFKLRGDRMPVGYYVLEKEHFQTLIQPLEKGDGIYTCSDGIQDQPGGMENNPLGRKFLAKNLTAFLSENCSKPMQEQRRLLDIRINEWRNGRPQVDDMTMIGIRICKI